MNRNLFRFQIHFCQHPFRWDQRSVPYADGLLPWCAPWSMSRPDSLRTRRLLVAVWCGLVWKIWIC